MNEDEDRGSSSGPWNKVIVLTLGNFVAWMNYVMNRIKGLRSSQLERMILTGEVPVWTPPTHDMEIMVRGQLERVYADDRNGIDDCNHDRGELRKEKSFFFSMLPRAVSIIYSSISESILDKMRIQVDYEIVYHSNDVVGLLRMAQFASMGEGSSTIYQNMALLMGLKINGNFFDYVKMYQQYRRRAHA